MGLEYEDMAVNGRRLHHRTPAHGCDYECFGEWDHWHGAARPAGVQEGAWWQRVSPSYRVGMAHGRSEAPAPHLDQWRIGERVGHSPCDGRNENGRDRTGQARRVTGRCRHDSARAGWGDRQSANHSAQSALTNRQRHRRTGTASAYRGHCGQACMRSVGGAITV